MPTVDTFLPDFIQTTFFSGYTVFNTLVYGLILIVIIFAIIKMFKKIEIDPKSIIFSLIPFIIFGSSTRALVDNGIYPKTVFLITPGIYILVGLLTIFTLLFSVFLYNKKGIDYRYVIFLIGMIFAIPNLILIPHINLIAMGMVVGVWICGVIIFILISHFWSLFKDKYNFAIIAAHLFDASTTFIAVDFFNYCEQHVLAKFFYGFVDTSFSMFPMKIVVIVLVLYVIDNYIEDETVKNLLKLAVFVLGLAPGLRNFLTLAIGTI